MTGVPHEPRLADHQRQISVRRVGGNLEIDLIQPCHRRRQPRKRNVGNRLAIQRDRRRVRWYEASGLDGDTAPEATGTVVGPIPNR